MRTRRSTLLVLLFLSVLFSTVPNGYSGQITENRETSQLLKSQGMAPLHFIPNQGQMDERVKYYAKNGSQEIYVTDEGVFLAITKGKQLVGLPRDTSKPFALPERPVIESQIVKLAPLGMLPGIEVIPEDLREAKVNWLIGNDPRNWKSNLPTYGAVTFRGAQEGLDLRFYGKDRQLEYDLIVKPGQDPSQIRMTCTRVDYFELTEDGDLLINLMGGVTLLQKKPKIYQVINGNRVSVEGGFRVYSEQNGPSVKGLQKSGELPSEAFVYGFDVDSYDPSIPIIIDPVIVYAEYLELQASGEDYSVSIDVDSGGNASVCGYTWSTVQSFSALADSYNMAGLTSGHYNVFVKNLDIGGGDRFTTYLGGNNDSYGYSIASDASGYTYVTGHTIATNFPMQSPIYSSNRGNGDAFMTKLSPVGTIVFSTYLGGTGGDFGTGIAIDGSGAAYLTGYTTSTNFPVLAGAFCSTHSSGTVDAFISKIDTVSPALVYSTFLGGGGNNYGNAIAVDSSGYAYVTGWTYSSTFPLAGTPFQTTLRGVQDAFALKLHSSGFSLVYSTYLGGSMADAGLGIAVDSGGNAYVAGQTNSSDFPLYGAYRSGLSGETDGFVSKLNPLGSALVYSTYVGGSKVDIVYGIAVNSLGEAFIAGETDSSDFPTRNAFHGTKDEYTSAFVTKLNAQGNDVVFSSYYLGSLGQDKAKGIALDDSSGVYFTGYTDLLGFSNAFAVKLADSNDPSITVVTPNGGETLQAGTNKTIRWSYTGDPGDTVTIELLRDATVDLIIDAAANIGTSGNGYYSWTIPNDQAAGANYLVRVQSNTNSLYKDTSDVAFTITEGIPSAEFSAEPTTTAAGEQVVFTDLSTGPITSWAWEFGDGGMSSEKNPTHTYSAEGHHNVSLRVTGPGGSSTINKVGYISVEPKITVVTPNGGEAILAGSNQLIRWTHQGSSTTTVNIELLKGGTFDSYVATSVPIGLHSHSWTVPASTVPGNDYTIKISSTIYSSTDASDAVFSIKPILADFSASPTSGAATLPVTFTDRSTGSATGWLWEFGDGFTSAAQNPTHDYTAPGDYSVSLTVSGLAGSDSMTKAGYIHVTLPAADFTAASTTGAARLSVGFLDKSTGTVTDYLWTFGDGTTSTLRNPTHEYVEPGVYSVSLKITFAGGTGTDTATKTGFIHVIPPVADFSGSPTSGVGPLSVTFADRSTGTVTGWLWSFGDGETDTGQNPTHEYLLPGVYSVSLTISFLGGTGTDTAIKESYIRVSPPVADFSATPTTGLAPLTVSFSNLSSGAITGWLWDFGDGQPTSIEQNPVHQYTRLGTYTVTLTVTGPGGTSTMTKPSYILVPGITVTTPNDGESYSAGQTMTIHWNYVGSVGSKVKIELLKAGIRAATVSLGAPIGSGGTGSYNYTIPVSRAPGDDYKIRVTSTTAPAYQDVSDSFFTINPPAPVAAFKATPVSGMTSLSVNFSNTTSGNATEWSWDFGDGEGTSTIKTPSYTYTTAGTYSVSLTARGPGGANTQTRTAYITVNPAPTITVTGPTAGVTWAAGSSQKINWSYTGNPGTYVKIELLKGGTSAATIVARTSILNGASGYSWTLPTSLTPGHDYQVKVASTTNGSYTDTTEVFNITEPAPVADFTGTPVSGRLPLEVSFINSSTGTFANSQWDFGDGTPNSTATNPVHTYTTAGVYTVTLTVEGPGGQSTKTSASYISVTDQAPSADFTATPTSGVAPVSAAFTDASHGAITTWSWDFGDGQGSTQRHPTHSYSNPGTYAVSLTVVGNGGTDRRTKSGYITANYPPVVADFTPTLITGTAPLAVSFTNGSSGIGNTWLWNFGDSTTSTQKEPVHSYTSPGSYTVTLTASGPGGTNTKTVTNCVQVAYPPPVANFTANTTLGAPPLNVTFTDSSTGTITTRAWTFGDGGTSTLQNPTHQYTTEGTYTVTLTVTGPGGSDAKVRTDYIRVYASPLAEFTADQTVGNTPLTAQFTNLSTGTIASYLWDFGDATTSTVQTPPPHSYTNGGASTITRTVTLTVTGPGGTNTKTRTNYITVKPPVPVAGFTANTTSGLKTLAVAFTNQTVGAVTTWDWNFGDGTAHSTLLNPSHSYANAGTYSVTLTATGPGGTNTVVKTNYITVYTAPSAGFKQNNVAGNISGAADFTVQFTDTSTGNISSWTWDFGDGQTSTEQHPSHVFTSTATRTVRLTVTGPTGATSSKTYTVTVTAPTITVVTPNGGETWTRGNQYNITWTYAGTPGAQVTIEVLKSGVVVDTLGPASIGTGGSGSFPWLIPSGHTTGATQFKVRVKSTTNGAYVDSSNNSFTIN